MTILYRYSQIIFITKYNLQLKLIDLRIYIKTSRYIIFYKIIYMFEHCKDSSPD